MSNERKLLKEALNFINFVSTTDGSGLALRIKEELAKPEHEPVGKIVGYLKKSQLDYLLELSIAVKAMRDQALYNENWYTFIPCEFSENVDTALNNITGE